MTICADTIPSKSPHAVSRIIDGEAVVVDPSKGLVSVLNAVGTRIWELTDNRRTTGQIANLIADEFDVRPIAALEDAVGFLENMLEKELICIRELEDG